MRSSIINQKIQGAVNSLRAQGYDVIPFNYYHYRKLTGVIPQKINYFTQASGENAGTEYITEEFTNMKLKGQVEYPFLAQAIMFKIYSLNDSKFEEVDPANLQATLLNKMLTIYQRGVVTLNIQSKEIFKISPLERIPAGTSAYSNLDIAGVGATGKLYLFDNIISGQPEKTNKFPIEILLNPNVQFELDVEFPSTTIDLGNNVIKMGFILEGLVFRK